MKESSYPDLVVKYIRMRVLKPHPCQLDLRQAVIVGHVTISLSIQFFSKLCVHGKCTTGWGTAVNLFRVELF